MKKNLVLVLLYMMVIGSYAHMVGAVDGGTDSFGYENDDENSHNIAYASYEPAISAPLSSARSPESFAGRLFPIKKNNGKYHSDEVVHEVVKELGELLDDMYPLYKEVEEYIRSPWGITTSYEFHKSILDSFKTAVKFHKNSLHNLNITVYLIYGLIDALNGMFCTINIDRESLLGFMESIKKNGKFLYETGPYYSPTTKQIEVKVEDELFHKMSKLSDKLEQLSDKITFHAASLMKARSHPLAQEIKPNVYSHDLNEALLENFVKERGKLEDQGQRATLAEKQKDEVLAEKEAALSQRNWSLVATGVLGALLLEALREKSYLRRGAHAVLKKIKGLFRKEPSRFSEKSKAKAASVINK